MAQLGLRGAALSQAFVDADVEVVNPAQRPADQDADEGGEGEAPERTLCGRSVQPISRSRTYPSFSSFLESAVMLSWKSQNSGLHELS